MSLRSRSQPQLCRSAKLLQRTNPDWPVPGNRHLLHRGIPAEGHDQSQRQGEGPQLTEGRSSDAGTPTSSASHVLLVSKVCLSGPSLAHVSTSRSRYAMLTHQVKLALSSAEAGHEERHHIRYGLGWNKLAKAQYGIMSVEEKIL